LCLIHKISSKQSSAGTLGFIHV